MITIPYDQCRSLIKDADILLFRRGHFPSVGWWIGAYSQSIYSHVGIAHWEDDHLYCLEFREFRGARKYPVSEYLKDSTIDVHRVCEEIQVPYITEVNGEYFNCFKQLIFTPEIATQIVKAAERLIDNNEHYGYRLIFRILRTYIPFVRLFIDPCNDVNGSMYVCSTLITKTFRKFYKDPVDFLADEYTKPADIARSAIFNEMFTIGT